MSGVTGLAPLTGLASLVNSTGQPDAGSAARAAAPTPVTDGVRPVVADTQRPVVAGTEPGDPAVTRRESRGSREAQAGVGAVADPASARREITRTGLSAPVADDLAAAGRDAGQTPEARLRRFIEAIETLRGAEPRELTAARITAALADGYDGPPPDPDAPLVGDGLPKPVEIVVTDLLAEEADSEPFGQNDDLPRPVEPIASVSQPIPEDAAA